MSSLLYSSVYDSRSQCTVSSVERDPMDDFTIINLLEVEDSVAGRMSGLEGRFARTSLDSRDIGVSHFRYAPHLRAATGHRHGQQEEVYIVVSRRGSGSARRRGARAPPVGCRACRTRVVELSPRDPRASS